MKNVVQILKPGPRATRFGAMDIQGAICLLGLFAAIMGHYAAAVFVGGCLVAMSLFARDHDRAQGV